MKNRGLAEPELNQYLPDIDLRHSIWRSTVNTEAVERVSVWVVQDAASTALGLPRRVKNGEGRIRTCTVTPVRQTYIQFQSVLQLLV